jgi:hypothetical protein
MSQIVLTPKALCPKIVLNAEGVMSQSPGLSFGNHGAKSICGSTTPKELRPIELIALTAVTLPFPNSFGVESPEP